MNKDKFQDKYQEIFQEIKEEKMNWNFEDFLQKIEENSSDEKIVPLQKKSGGNQKWFLMAASFALILSLGILIKFFYQNEPNHINQTISEAINKQKKAGEFDQNYANAQVINAEKNTEENTEKSKIKIVSDDIIEEKIDKILPKKARIKKISKPRYVMQKTLPKETENNKTEYNPNYVIINGHKIESEEEAINVTKYSFQMLSEKVSKTLATTEGNMNTDY